MEVQFDKLPIAICAIHYAPINALFGNRTYYCYQEPFSWPFSDAST